MRLIDATTLKAEFTGNFQEAYTPGHIWAIIDNAPAIDAVPIVRCKDCRFLGIKDFAYGYCEGKITGIVRPDDFCAWGEK